MVKHCHLIKTKEQFQNKHDRKVFFTYRVLFKKMNFMVDVIICVRMQLVWLSVASDYTSQCG